MLPPLLLLCGWLLSASSEPIDLNGPDELSDDMALSDEADLPGPLADDVPDNSDALSTDVDRWVLHDVLATYGRAQSQPWTERLKDLGEQSTASGWQERVLRNQTEQRLRGEPLAHHAAYAGARRFDIPLADHPLVDVYIDYFTGRGRWFFAKWLERSVALIPLMRPILARRGVPEDLVYLAMIESGFSPRAYSTAAAAGYWQFIPSTGRLFGLKRDLFVDERRDPVRSTEAAAGYLKALHRSLGDWHLAWASYNAGEGRIRRALMKTHSMSFWQLAAHKKVLAKETVHYVPKIIAAAIVAKDAARYGFVVPEQPAFAFDVIDVKGALDLRALARGMRIDPATLRDLNPALIYGVTPPNRTTHLRVPPGLAGPAEQVLAKLPVRDRLTYASYSVKRGDTLISIAKRFGSNVETLRQFNHLNAKPIRPGQKLVVPGIKLLPSNAPEKLAARGKKAGTTRVARNEIKSASRGSKRRVPSLIASTKAQRPKRRHVVAQGDTLWSIARRYRVPMAAIRSQHRHHSDRLAVGEVLEIF